MLYMDKANYRLISGMSVEEIWKSHPQFQLYELEKFKNYNSNMKKLTAKRRGLINEEEEAFRNDMLKLPPNTMTCRGYPFWNNHPASDLLEKDEISGVAKEMKPKYL